jgi:hypothetical protein
MLVSGARTLAKFAEQVVVPDQTVCSLFHGGCQWALDVVPNPSRLRYKRQTPYAIDKATGLFRHP